MMESIPKFINCLNKIPCTYKLKIRSEQLMDEWSNWLISPTETYLETERQGPYPVTQIEWIDINPIESRNPGRLMPPTETNYSTAVIKLLNDCSLPYDNEGGIFRIFISSINA